MPENNERKRRGGATEPVAKGRRDRAKASATADSAAPETGRDAAANETEIEVSFKADSEMLAAAEAELGPAPDLRRGHYVIDPGTLRAEIGDSFDPDREPTSPEEANRIARLRRFAADPNALFKPHLVADGALIGRLEAVRALAPNANEVLDVVIGAARVSALTGAPLDIPPLVLLGPAGCGKTYVVHLLGRALNMPLLTLLGSTMADATSILGSGVGWKGAGPARLTETLIAAQTSAPLVFIDEVEKMRIWDRRDNAADILLGLLDRAMAAEHQDLYDRVPIRADRVIWMLAANSIVDLSTPLLDRCLVIEMSPPSRAERREIVGRIHAAVRARLGLDTVVSIGAGAIEHLDDISLRRIGPAIQLALGRAVGAGRDRLETDDVTWALAVVERGRTPKRQRIGF